jgi:hypothetical protein
VVIFSKSNIYMMTNDEVWFRFIKVNLTLFILLRHTSKLNYRVIFNTVQCDSICRYLLPLHV